MSNPLDPTSLLHLLQQLLPVTTSSPLPQATDAIAALVHAIHTALYFRLIPGSTPSTAPAQPGSRSGVDDDAASETTTAVEQGDNDAQVPEGRLPEGWNSRGEDSYAFEYRHEQSSMTFRIRIGRMGGRVQIDAMAAVCVVPVRHASADGVGRRPEQPVCRSRGSSYSNCVPHTRLSDRFGLIFVLIC